MTSSLGPPHRAHHPPLPFFELRPTPSWLNSKETSGRFSGGASLPALSVPYAKVGSTVELKSGREPAVMSLADEVAAAHAGNPNPAALVGEFRRTPVLIPLINDSLMSAELSGIRWLYAFSDEQELARFAASRGAAPETELSYARAVGARLLDVVIPAIEGPAGVVLDAGSEQGMVFPPVSGIVPDSAAIDLIEPGQADSGPGAPVAGGAA
ncbi:SseB family protein [Streptomyces libani]|uniref:SseB family protein n=1 Tax=Streptomyces nigrescens TaxID=1920 RepID=UPI002251E0A1|nr:SseB family protein [Streptomyces libani]MCX5450969.1 SseB family protein [Streptomyces libani]